MDLRKLKTLIDLVSESQISELEITEAEGKVRIVRGGVAPLVQQFAASPAPVQMPAAATASPASSAAVLSATAAEVATPAGNIIKSPMVGTFYFASSPGAKPFVEIGQSVKAGETVCIIEAMKILNEIESEFDGTIKRCLVTNGQAVEYGQPLFEIE
jgi:acetyl-CoA carboxylase biotin carboxyl carrier protein